ncbi:MAG: hypothetical protein WD824_16320, partial [Cyclobacteriaceae bacterium]
MFARLLSLTLLIFLYSGLFAQEKFTIVKDLRAEWMTFQDGAYKPLGELPFTGLNTIYFGLEPHAFAGNFLRIESDKPYFLFVNGRVTGEYEGEVLLNIDSLSQKVNASSFWIALHQNKINERDLNSEVILMQAPLRREAENASRPYSHFRDFVVVSGLVIILLFLLALRLNPKLAADYFSISR